MPIEPLESRVMLSRSLPYYAPVYGWQYTPLTWRSTEAQGVAHAVGVKAKSAGARVAAVTSAAAAAAAAQGPARLDPFYWREIRGGEEGEDADPLPYAGTTGPDAPALSGPAVEAVGFDSQASTSGYYDIPPDSNVAAGPGHVVDVVNTVIEWRTKAGALQNRQRLGKNASTAAGSFFAPLNPVNSLFDPKVTYDQHGGRFVVVALEEDDAAQTSRILVAVSQTSDPNQGWYFGAINSKVTTGNGKRGTQNWTDYPGLAVDAQAIYVTGNLFAFGGRQTFGGTRLWIIPKSAFYSGGAMTSNVYDPASASGLGATTGFTLQPAQMYGTAPGGVGTFLVSSGYVSGATDQLSVIRVTNALSSPTFSNQMVSLGDVHNGSVAFPGDVPQLGSSQAVDGGDQRVMNAVWRDGYLWACNSVNPPSGPDAGQETAHWYRISTSNLSALSLADQGNVSGEEIAAGTRTFYPWISVDAAGDMAIGFAASGPGIYPGAYYTGRLASDPAGAVQPARALAAGVDYYYRAFGSDNRWGDYSGLALDPSDQATFWVFGEYAQTRGTVLSQYASEDGRWGTRVGSFSFLTSVAGAAYRDNDFSGARDGAAEAGIAGVAVFLDGNGNGSPDAGEPVTTTAADGSYAFTALAAGTYQVRVVGPSGYVGTGAGVRTVTAGAGTPVAGADFGYFPTSFAGVGAGANNFYLRLDAGGTVLQISQAPLAAPTYAAPVSALPALSFTTSGGGDGIWLDLTNGPPLPGAGASYSGSSSSSLVVQGSAGADAVALGASAVTLNGGPALSYAGPSSISVSTGGGDDAVTLNGSIPAALALGPGADVLTLDASALTVPADLGAAGSPLPGVTVNANNSTVLFAASQHLAALNLTGSSTAELSGGGNKVLVLGGLSIGAGATLDLADNDMAVDPAGTPVAAPLASAYAGGAWTGAGLTSSAARDNAGHDTGLGYATAGQLGVSTFAGQPVSAAAVVVKYTYAGDANLDGRVTGDDFALADRGRAGGLSGWANGDFNYDGVIDGSDLTLVNRAFAAQGPAL